MKYGLEDKFYNPSQAKLGSALLNEALELSIGCGSL